MTCARRAERLGECSIDGLEGERARGRLAGPVRRVALIAAVCLVVAGITGQQAAAAVSFQVAGLQVALYRFGKYAGPIDGISGPQTKQAIRNFQATAGLQPDGVAGKQTRKALGRYGRPLFGVRTLKRGMVGSTSPSCSSSSRGTGFRRSA